MSAPQRSRALALLLLIVPALAACEQSEPKAQPAPPLPQVTVATPLKKVAADLDEYVGRFVAVESVEIRGRVSGYLEAIHFRDGQLVQQGDLLFTIDRRPFQSALAQARANLAQARANLAFAESDLARAQNVRVGTVISQQTLDQRVQAKRVAEASVAAQEAAERQAALDLEFTELRAPVSGRIGDRRVSQGNLVTGGTSGSTTLLATVQSTDPIRFEFTLDEAAYLHYARPARDVADPTRGLTVPVKLKLLDEAEFTHEGRLDFIDNAIDRSTGTMRARAEFANPKATLTPGMFGRVQVAAGPPSEVLVVPDAAIGTEQASKYVLVVDDENVARPKYVTPGALIDGLRVAEGLAEGDRVIVNGLMRVRPGVRVVPRVEAASAATATDSNKP